MRKEVKYIADDGKEFFDANECLSYEAKEKAKRTKKIQEEMIRLDDELWEKYVGKYEGTAQPTLLTADLWLKNDIAAILMKFENYLVDTKDEIVGEIEKSPYGKEIMEILNFDKIMKSVLIRKDFKTALSKVKNGSSLSEKLGYSLSPGDLKELAKLHKSNKCRRKIEELLTDCNFHTECGKFASKQYDEYLKG